MAEDDDSEGPLPASSAVFQSLRIVFLMRLLLNSTQQPTRDVAHIATSLISVGSRLLFSASLNPILDLPEIQFHRRAYLLREKSPHSSIGDHRRLVVEAYYVVSAELRDSGHLADAQRHADVAQQWLYSGEIAAFKEWESEWRQHPLVRLDFAFSPTPEFSSADSVDSAHFGVSLFDGMTNMGAVDEAVTPGMPSPMPYSWCWTPNSDPAFSAITEILSQYHCRRSHCGGKEMTFWAFLRILEEEKEGSGNSSACVGDRPFLRRVVRVLEKRLRSIRAFVLRSVFFSKRFSRVTCVRNCLVLGGTFAFSPKDRKRQFELYLTAYSMLLSIFRSSLRLDSELGHSRMKKGRFCVHWGDSVKDDFYQMAVSVIDLIISLCWTHFRSPLDALRYAETSKEMGHVLFSGGNSKEIFSGKPSASYFQTLIGGIPSDRRCYVCFYVVENCPLSPSDRVFRWVVKNGKIEKWDYRNMNQNEYLGNTTTSRRLVDGATYDLPLTPKDTPHVPDEAAGHQVREGPYLDNEGFPLTVRSALVTFKEALKECSAVIGEDDVMRGDVGSDNGEDTDDEEEERPSRRNPEYSAVAPSSGAAVERTDITESACYFLYSLLFKDLEEFLPFHDEGAIIIIPDRQLFKIPFLCLRNPFGDFFVENYCFVLNFSLVSVERTKRNMDDAVLFRKTLKQSNSHSKEAVAHHRVTSIVAGNAFYPVAPTKSDSNEPVLPFSRREVESCCKIFRHLKSAKNDVLGNIVLCRKQLRRKNIRENSHLHHPKIIHLAAHCRNTKKTFSELANDVSAGGSFLEESASDTFRPSGHIVCSYSEPLFASNVNDYWELEGTQFVYLSTCASAKCDASAKRSLNLPVGFHRAFFNSGVGSVFCTLWNVFDKIGCFVAENFYFNVARQKIRARRQRKRRKRALSKNCRTMTCVRDDCAEKSNSTVLRKVGNQPLALRNAILRLMKLNNGRFRSMPPVWAPFQLYGEPYW